MGTCACVYVSRSLCLCVCPSTSHLTSPSPSLLFLPPCQFVCICVHVCLCMNLSLTSLPLSQRLLDLASGVFSSLPILVQPQPQGLPPGQSLATIPGHLTCNLRKLNSPVHSHCVCRGTSSTEPRAVGGSAVSHLHSAVAFTSSSHFWPHSEPCVSLTCRSGLAPADLCHPDPDHAGVAHGASA